MSHRSESNLGGNVPTAIGESEATRQLEGPPVYAHATLESCPFRKLYPRVAMVKSA
jgi:hypothetical protein